MQFMISRDVFGVTLHLTTLVKKKKEKKPSKRTTT